MRIGGQRHPNCTLEIPRYGMRRVVVTTLGHGMSIFGTEGFARAKRTYYPFVRTSGTWFIEVSMADARERSELSGWIRNYMYEASHPGMRNLPPVTVTLPAEEFKKVGYPKGTIDFGESYETGIYTSIIQFTSASDALAEASTVLSPTRDRAARSFYPSGNQSSNFVQSKSEIVFREGTYDSSSDSQGTVIGRQGGPR